jgi:hypothetical protein
MCSGVCPGVCSTVIVTKFKYLAVPHAAERKIGRRFSEQNVLGTGGFSQCAARRDMVGVKMRVDNVANPHSRRVCSEEVQGRVTERIDHGCDSASAAANQIGGRDGIGVKKLT